MGEGLRKTSLPVVRQNPLRCFWALVKTRESGCVVAQAPGASMAKGEEGEGVRTTAGMALLAVRLAATKSDRS